MPTLTILLLLVAAGLAFVIWRMAMRWRALFRARAAGVPMSMRQLIGMWFRKTPIKVFDHARQLYEAGVAVPLEAVETHFWARGDFTAVTRAMILAAKYDEAIEWDVACAIDLAGRDVVDVVESTQRDQRVEIPPEDEDDQALVVAAGDGQSIRVRGEATCRLRVSHVVGGALIDTLVKRIGDQLTQQISSTQMHSRRSRIATYSSDESLKRNWMPAAPIVSAISSSSISTLSRLAPLVNKPNRPHRHGASRRHPTSPAASPAAPADPAEASPD